MMESLVFKQKRDTGDFSTVSTVPCWILPEEDKTDWTIRLWAWRLTSLDGPDCERFLADGLNYECIIVVDDGKYSPYYIFDRLVPNADLAKDLLERAYGALCAGSQTWTEFVNERGSGVSLWYGDIGDLSISQVLGPGWRETPLDADITDLPKEGPVKGLPLSKALRIDSYAEESEPIDGDAPFWKLVEAALAAGYRVPRPLPMRVLLESVDSPDWKTRRKTVLSNFGLDRLFYDPDPRVAVTAMMKVIEETNALELWKSLNPSRCAEPWNRGSIGAAPAAEDTSLEGAKEAQKKRPRNGPDQSGIKQ